MAETLSKAGVERIYGVVGDSLNGFTDSLRRRKSIDWVHSYPKAIKISDAQMSVIKIQHDPFHGEWNYTIAPNHQLASEAIAAGASDDR
jgi:hypothetical protein